MKNEEGMTKEEAAAAYIREWLKDEYALNSEDRKALNTAIKALEQEDSSTNFKDELKTLVAKRLDEINHFISGCNSPFSYSQIREVQELMCDISTTLGIEVEE